MGKLTHHEFIILLISMAAMLILSRVLAEFGRKLKFPIVMGEIVAGILLGPTILGIVFPSIFSEYFPSTGSVSIALDGIAKISVVMMLFVTGMEVQLPIVLKQGKAAIYTSVMGMVIPFASGFFVAFYFPFLFGITDEHFRLLFALFLGTALSISALPVISRILIDMNMFKTKIGTIIIASAMFNDLIGWLIFSFILGMLNTTGGEAQNVWLTLAYILGFGLFMLTIGKMIIDKSLPWMQKKLSWPGGILSISLGICFLCAAYTESIGLHAILGAFIAGIAFGDSVHLNEKAREIIHQFVTNIFAPFFFVSIGLKVNFITNFDLQLVVVILVLAYIGKVVGASLGAYLGGFSKNESLAVGFGMNARGAMEIILGTLALNAGLINARIFVALVVMALITSLTSGPLIHLFVSKEDAAKK
ncbi:MAG TPA: cation:proton antiporter [Bacteroidia bacterium]|nr:cation:proton antiporter [Bacteroidia bacterium]